MAPSSSSIPHRCRSGWRWVVLLALAWLSVQRAWAAEQVQIYPSGNAIPANHLKFYIHFPKPMRTGVFLEHCRLLKADGSPVLEPFRETELWSDDRRRLTLWLHPGRQKTGVNLNVEFGPVLEPGGEYTLVISSAWPAEDGTLLGADHRRHFRAGPRIIGQLDRAEWTISKPAAGSREALEVRFPAPLDHALLLRCFHVRGADGERISGSISIDQAERRWRFTPERPWPAGKLTLRVESILEDLAGNSLARPFEVDLQGPPPRRVGRFIEVPLR